MLSKNRFWAFMTALILISNLIFAGCSPGKEALSKNKSPSNFKAGSEPAGFRGIQWGTDISDLSEMEYWETDLNYVGGLKVYTKKGDDLRIGGAELTKIKYGFWSNKFYGVTIYTNGYENWLGLKDVVFEKFGEGEYQFDKLEETYSWIGDMTGMVMGYDELAKEGRLGIFSLGMNKQEKALEKEKTKEDF